MARGCQTLRGGPGYQKTKQAVTRFINLFKMTQRLPPFSRLVSGRFGRQRRVHSPRMLSELALLLVSRRSLSCPCRDIIAAIEKSVPHGRSEQFSGSIFNNISPEEEE